MRKIVVIALAMMMAAGCASEVEKADGADRALLYRLEGDERHAMRRCDIGMVDECDRADRLRTMIRGYRSHIWGE